MRTRLLALLLLALPFLTFSQYKPWYNFANFAYGAKARAMGNAFTAVADDLSAVFWNPAGLSASTSSRSPELFLCYAATSQWHDYDLQDRPVGTDTWLYDYRFHSRLNQIDFFSVSVPAVLFKRPWTFALGYYRYLPYGFKGESEESLTSLKHRFQTRVTTVAFTGSEGMDVLAFSASASLTRYFSLGATLQQFFGSGSMVKRTEDLWSRTQSQIIEKLPGRNVIVGALFAPLPALRLGFTWHSRLRGPVHSDRFDWTLDDAGNKTLKQEASCTASVLVPEQYSLGALLRPAPWLDISVETARIDWHRSSISGYYGAGEPLPFPQKADWPRAQKQVRNIRLGGEARLPIRFLKLSLRGGWSLDRQLYADALDEAVRVKGYSCGIGCEFSRRLQADFTFQRQVADWLEDSYLADTPPSGTHYRANVLMLALTYRFGDIFRE